MSHDKDKKQAQNRYTWKNKQQYPHRGIKQLTEKLLVFQNEQKEIQLVTDLFNKMKKASVTNMIYLNDQTKQLSLQTIPKQNKIIKWSSEKLQYLRMYDDLRNRFTYHASVGHQFGGRGTFGLFGALASRKNTIYSLTYSKRLWERLDNYYTANTDEVDMKFSWHKVLSLDFVQIGFKRESRQNQVNPFDKNQTETKIFGLNESEAQITKNSNLFSVAYQLKKGPFSVFGKMGLDFSNESIFKQLGLKFQKLVYQRESFDVQVSLEAANIWGKNILKNDLLFRNYSSWPGNRSKNMLSPRVQIFLKNYPFLSSLNINPFIYTQLWSTFHKNQQAKYDTRIQAEYGIGLFSKQNYIKCQIGLLKFSAQRKLDVFGSFKFSF